MISSHVVARMGPKAPMHRKAFLFEQWTDDFDLAIAAGENFFTAHCDAGGALIGRA